MNTETRTEISLLLVSGVFAAIFASALLLARYGPSPSAEVEVLATVLLICCLAVATPFMASLTMRKVSGWRNARKFQKTFGCFPNQPPGLGHGRVWRKVVQGSVDGVLRTLAKKLGDAFRQEEKTIRQIDAEITPFSKKPMAEIRFNMRLLAGSRAIVRMEKERFWNAHRCARQHDFSVKESYKDYLKGG